MSGWPIRRACSQIEICGEHQGKHHALNCHIKEVGEPSSIAMTESYARQARNIHGQWPANWLVQRTHDSPLGRGVGDCPRGHSHPIIVTITSGAPIGTAHGVKIDPTNAAETVSAVKNGQMLGPGSSSLC